MSDLAKRWRNEVIYQIFIDRFAGYELSRDPKKAHYLGGTIRGITESLDYIQDLGATSIYITPFLKGVGYHGYHVTDFFAVDESFGTKDDLHDLVNAVHKRGMKIIIDFVPNHCSVEHPFFKDAQTNPESEYRDWFFFDEWPQGYKSFLQFRELVKFNLDHPPARQHIIDSVLYWVGELGVDSVRLDHVLGPSLDFWNEFRRQVKAAYPEVFLIAEAYIDNLDNAYANRETLNVPVPWDQLMSAADLAEANHILLKGYGQVFDGYMDFYFAMTAQKFVGGKISHAEARERIQRHYGGLHNDVLFLALLDNHDMERILFLAGGDVNKVLEAITIQFEVPQPKIIYYGSELEMTQERSFADAGEHGDVHARMPMPLPHERSVDSKVLQHYRNIIKARRQDLLEH